MHLIKYYKHTMIKQTNPNSYDIPHNYYDSDQFVLQLDLKQFNYSVICLQVSWLTEHDDMSQLHTSQSKCTRMNISEKAFYKFKNKIITSDLD